MRFQACLSLGYSRKVIIMEALSSNRVEDYQQKVGDFVILKVQIFALKLTDNAE